MKTLSTAMMMSEAISPKLMAHILLWSPRILEAVRQKWRACGYVKLKSIGRRPAAAELKEEGHSNREIAARQLASHGAVALGVLCVTESTLLAATGGQLVFRARDSTYFSAAGLGGLMAMTQVEKSIMERTFYIKLGPTPAFPPRPAETGQVKPARDDEPLINPQAGKR
jgi:hypothetical protein